MSAAGKISPALRAMFLLLALACSGCAGTLTGQVLDARTGQPVARAVVLGVWTKAAGLPGLPHTEVVDVSETETDAQGRFTLERAGGLVIDEESLTVYKFGYVAWNNLYVFPSSARRESTRIPSKIALDEFPQTQSHQSHISFLGNAAAVFMYGWDRIPKLWKGIQPERKMR